MAQKKLDTFNPDASGKLAALSAQFNDLGKPENEREYSSEHFLRVKERALVQIEYLETQLTQFENVEDLVATAKQTPPANEDTLARTAFREMQRAVRNGQTIAKNPEFDPAQHNPQYGYGGYHDQRNYTVFGQNRSFIKHKIQTLDISEDQSFPVDIKDTLNHLKKLFDEYHEAYHYDVACLAEMHALGAPDQNGQA